MERENIKNEEGSEVPEAEAGSSAPSVPNAEGETFAAETAETGEASAIDAAEALAADDELERELALRRAKNKAPETEEEREERIRSISEKFDSSVDYTTVLDNFEGPLDLLLYLINKNEIEIEDIFVSQVTEQFLEYMKGLPYIGTHIN